MQSFEQIQSFYKSLVENFSILSIDQKPKQDVEELIITGTPTSSELYIGILHRLVNKYPQLINTVEKKKEFVKKFKKELVECGNPYLNTWLLKYSEE